MDHDRGARRSHSRRLDAERPPRRRLARVPPQPAMEVVHPRGDQQRLSHGHRAAGVAGSSASGARGRLVRRWMATARTLRSLAGDPLVRRRQERHLRLAAKRDREHLRGDRGFGDRDARAGRRAARRGRPPRPRRPQRGQPPRPGGAGERRPAGPRGRARRSSARARRRAPTWSTASTRSCGRSASGSPASRRRYGPPSLTLNQRIRLRRVSGSTCGNRSSPCRSRRSSRPATGAPNATPTPTCL